MQIRNFNYQIQNRQSRRACKNMQEKCKVVEGKHVLISYPS